MSERLITTQLEFADFCGRMREAGTVGFDTEFVSEDTFRPDLCLLQFATAEESVAVDPFAVRDLTPWWDLMCDGVTTVVVHGGQAEINFCFQAVGRPPRNLIDVQLAEGLCSRGYPLSYQSLVARVLKVRVHGKETRTDWRRRPLSPQQIRYALEDVQHLLAVWRHQREKLVRLGRLAWAEAEFARMIGELCGEASDGWLRLSGVQKLQPRELAVAVEIFNWRAAEAARSNRPVRRVLRDDLILELARRQPRTRQELFASRDMNRSGYRRIAHDLLACIERGLELPEKELPSVPEAVSRERNQEEHVLGRLLGIALANRCAELDISLSLVGTNTDLRNLARWHVEYQRRGPPPKLAQGWRADVCGDLLEDLLDGKITLRVGNPQSDHPLVFERTNR